MSVCAFVCALPRRLERLVPNPCTVYKYVDVHARDQRGLSVCVCGVYSDASACGFRMYVWRSPHQKGRRVAGADQLTEADASHSNIERGRGDSARSPRLFAEWHAQWNGMERAGRDASLRTG